MPQDPYASIAKPIDPYASIAKPADPYADMSKTAEPAAKQGFFGSLGDQNAIVQAAKMAGNAIMHPGDTFKAINDLPNPNGVIANAVKGEAGRIGNELKMAWNSPDMAGALSHSISAIPVLGPGLDKAQDQYADKNYAGEMGTLTGLASNVFSPGAIKKGIETTSNTAGGALKGAGFAAKLASATPEAQKIAATRALVPGSPAELLTRALKPAVTMPDFEQSIENALPTIASKNPVGVSGLAKAANAGQDAEQAWYKNLTDPLRQFHADASPIADAQLKSIPIMDRIEKPATLQGASPGRMKTVTVPAGEGTKMTMGGIVGANPGELRGGIFNNTADIANNYRRPMPLGVIDDVRQDSNAKLNAFFNKAGGDRHAALSNPETARVAAVNDASRGLAYNNFSRLSAAGRTDVPTLPEITAGPNVSRLPGIPELTPGPSALTPAKIAAQQKLYGDLSDVATVAGKRATVAGRANPMSLQETLALKPSPMGVVDYLGQRMFKGLTNSDALTNAALDRYSSPNAFNLPSRMTPGAKIGSGLGKALDYAGSRLKRGN